MNIQDLVERGHGIIFTDGACSGNPGPGGWAAILLTPDYQVVELGGKANRVTNNQMELNAIIEALQFLKNSKALIAIHILTDSTYVIRGITEWVPKWKKNNWTTASGNEVANLDHWKDLAALVSERPFAGNLLWHHVRGHAGIPGNERADEIAVQFSLGRSPNLYDGPLKNYRVNLLSLSPQPGATGPSSKTKKSGKAYSYLSLVDHIPMRHSDWSSCENRVKGKSSAKFKKALSADDELEILRSWGVAPKDVK